ncbi:hypothetical protein SscP1EGY_38 [Streptomyces phage SscP1EGY]|nr:hypothetical protein SscP1EGY_38 [Streptomyces phage SscP1EGY]
MFDLSALFKRAGQVAAENSPAILTAIGVTGTLTTAYLAAKGALKASEALKEAEEAKLAEFHGEDPDKTGLPDPLTTQEKFEATWEHFVPAALSAAMTVTAIICSNRISDRRSAALASAYSVVKESYGEYQKKTSEKVGPKKAAEIKEEVAAEMVRRHPIRTTEIVAPVSGQVLFYDRWSGRYFYNDIETLRGAVNDFNQQLIHDMYMSLNEFWEKINLPSTTCGEYLGWTTDNLLETDITWVTIEGERVAFVDFKTLPVPKYNESY